MFLLDGSKYMGASDFQVSSCPSFHCVHESENKSLDYGEALRLKLHVTISDVGGVGHIRWSTGEHDLAHTMIYEYCRS